MTKSVYAVATMDTKGEELAYVAQCLRGAGALVRTVDVGTAGPPTIVSDVTREDVAGGAVLPTPDDDRGAAVTRMGNLLETYLVREAAADRVAGVIGIGGSGGTAIVTQAMRALPIGLPKLMVSTMASGNTAPYVDCSDLALMYSVVDVAGLNSVSRRVLGNAAYAMAGMVSHEIRAGSSRPAVGMTMFGVTTPCVTEVRRALEDRGFDCLVFHATGSGGRAMEKLVESGFLVGVIDVTTTEVADEVVGGVLACGPERFDRILASQIPYVISVGALDMVNFGARKTVPPEFEDRLFHVHNPQVTLMRTTPEENRRIARWITGKLNRSTAPLTLLLPEQGVSAIDAPGQPFHDPVADAALIEEFAATLDTNRDRRIVRHPHHINDPQFAAALVNEFLRQLAIVG